SPALARGGSPTRARVFPLGHRAKLIKLTEARVLRRQHSRFPPQHVAECAFSRLRNRAERAAKRHCPLQISAPASTIDAHGPPVLSVLVRASPRCVASPRAH